MGEAQTAFPLFGNATKYSQQRAAKLGGMAATVQTAIDELQPCNGTNQYQIFWRKCLEFHSNVDKHRHFGLTTFATLGGFWDPGLPMNSASFIHAGPVSRGTILARVPRDQGDVRFLPVFEIAFSDGPAIDGNPERAVVSWLLHSIEMDAKAIILNLGKLAGIK